MKSFAFSCFIIFGLIQLSFAQDTSNPNFVFILTDDQSYGYMGCTGNPIVKTPNLDKLAEEGILFTNAHVTSAICTPSRASILLSEFERKHGINFNSGTSMRVNAWEDSYPMVMRRNGYYTGWIGKNHVPVGEGGYTSGVMEKSFDYWYAGHGHLRFYPKQHHEIFRAAKSDTQAEIISEGVSDFLSNEQKLEGSIKFLNERPKNQPFMLSVCFNLPHGAGTSSMKQKPTDDEIYKSLYRDQDLPLPTNYVAKADIVTPKLPPKIHHVADRQTGYDYVDTPEDTRERYTRQLQAMTGIDRMVGQLRQTLKDQGLDKNTVIIFTSDHGLFMGQHGLGGKAFCYETTTHVPMIVYDPKARRSSRRRKIDALVQSIDVAPTMLEMADIPIPDSYQGKSLVPLMTGQSKAVRDYLFTENLWSTQFGNPRCESVQDLQWKYIRYYKNNNFSARKKIATAKALGVPVNAMLYKVHDPDIAIYRSYIEGPLQGEEPVYEELYHLADDPEESTNLIGDQRYTEQYNRLKAAWKQSIIAARGSEAPRVLRYTSDSEAERGVAIEPK
ncbi:sulfatase-like hydrolase/transferase [Marinoscillum furvescens]|uniref:Arylsulfatase A-like enzyme n=1 Tax=Marinoscillum furvescens DSM 4134 TaxID=1122208 RepID=A0A3D9KZL6_MARFU|nr:sulfatase-like hydrolase/transferase [Marinoscillum furvescens]RED96007.1 arylsulfatase A-like enzyme [Marinoscillum furvescens DSM 4134]